MKTTCYAAEEIEIMKAALPIVEAVPAAQDDCWPGDGPAHDDHCALADHAAATAAVSATEGLSWDFSSWSRTAAWFRGALERCPKTGVRLSAPSKSGYRAEFESIEEARIAAAALLDIAVGDMIEVESGDGGTTYCYASPAEADADRDGAYAVQYSEAV